MSNHCDTLCILNNRKINFVFYHENNIVIIERVQKIFQIKRKKV